MSARIETEPDPYQTAEMPQVPVLSADEYSQKKYGVAVALAGVFGILGVHHLYLKRWGEAALDIGLTVTAIALMDSSPGIALAVFLLDVLHTVVVTSLLLIGKWRDGDGRIVAYPGQIKSANPQQLQFAIHTEP